MRPMHSARLILASRSPRRSDLLARDGFGFEVDPADIPEEVEDGEDPGLAVARLAMEKALAVAVRRADLRGELGGVSSRAGQHSARNVAADGSAAGEPASGVSSEVYLGADTAVIVSGQMLGKPEDEAQACKFLTMISGRNHEVVTGWALIGPESAAGDSSPGSRVAIGGFVRSIVRMREISAAEARRYAAGGEPMDKAGAYAVQGDGGRFVAAVIGSLDNVIGLPVAEVARCLAVFGVEPSR